MDGNQIAKEIVKIAKEIIAGKVENEADATERMKADGVRGNNIKMMIYGIITASDREGWRELPAREAYTKIKKHVKRTIKDDAVAEWLTLAAMATLLGKIKNQMWIDLADKLEA